VDRKQLIYKYYVFLFNNDENRAAGDAFSGTIPQALFLMNGKMTNEALEPRYGNTTSRILSRYSDDSQRIEELYLTVLSRKPDETEMSRMLAFAADSRDAYQDVFWALLNSNEFLMNH
jgi:hypothetical protein